MAVYVCIPVRDTHPLPQAANEVQRRRGLARQTRPLEQDPAPALSFVKVVPLLRLLSVFSRLLLMPLGVLMLLVVLMLLMGQGSRSSGRRRRHGSIRRPLEPRQQQGSHGLQLQAEGRVVGLHSLPAAGG